MIGIVELQEKISHRSQIGYPIRRTCNFEKPHNYHKTLYLKAYGVADYEFHIGFSEFEMAGIIVWNFRGTLYSKVFEVADYEFDIGFSEFKMADPTWWT